LYVASKYLSLGTMPLFIAADIASAISLGVPVGLKNDWNEVPGPLVNEVLAATCPT